jgi:predicted TPR repeat methyltransferase
LRGDAGNERDGRERSKKSTKKNHSVPFAIICGKMPAAHEGRYTLAMSEPSVDQMMKQAMQQHRAGRLREAESLYRQVITRIPGQADALHLLGTIALQERRYADAQNLFEQAIAARPTEAVFQFNYATLWRNTGQRDHAIAALRQAVTLRPAFPEALVGLAELLLEAGDPDGAAQAARRCVEYQPGNAAAYLCLGQATSRKGDATKAATYFQQARALHPAIIEHTLRRAAEMTAAHRVDEGIAAWRVVIGLEPKLAAAHGNLGALLAKQKEFDAALAALNEALRLDGNNAEAHINLAMVLQRRGRNDGAIEHYREALRLKPQWDEAWFGLAMLTGERAPAAMPPAWVGRLFDDYADTFDQHLVGTLGYDIPEKLFAAVRQVQGARIAENPRVLDLGCGTGLCGVLFKPVAAQLVGVDLSARMIERARGRNVYDELHVADAMALLTETPTAFDVIIAADVLLYFGDLAPLLVAATRAMASGGLLAFSIETHEGDGYRLMPSGRYGHSVGYVRQLAAANGLQERHAGPVTIRLENDQPVAGHLFVLER